MKMWLEQRWQAILQPQDLQTAEEIGNVPQKTHKKNHQPTNNNGTTT